MSASDPYSTSPRQPSQGEEPPWELIAERIDAFAAAWDAALAAGADPPRLDMFTQAVNHGAARHLLIELAKLDLERRWQHDRQPQRVEWYAQQFAPLQPAAQLPADLIYEELQARMLAGRPIYEKEIRERFPAQADALLRLLGGMALSGSPTATYYDDRMVDGAPKPHAPTGVAAFAALKPGDQLDDFQLLSPLGSGAFARVFLARQVSMERLVALKISAQSGSEPQTLAQLDHPHIVRVFDQRQCENPPARLLYMEVISGGTLHEVITRTHHAYDGRPSGQLLLTSINDRLAAVGAAIPESSSSRDWIEEASWPEIVCRLGAELAEGLAYAHSRGVMHRDIKPANVLLSAEGRPKLADFNVSYNGGRADENPEDTFGGSLAYMSPEQLEACHPLLSGSPRDVREPSDIYALGVLLWELLTGRRPFHDEQLTTSGSPLVRLQRMIEARRQVDFAQLAAQLPADCPASLREVLQRCLEPNKSRRYPSADQLSRALRMCLHPRCWKLLQEPQGRIGRLALKHPILTVVVAGLIPNVLTAAFNWRYNYNRFLNDPELKNMYQRFIDVQFWINGIAFPLGIGVAWWAASKTFGVLQDHTPTDALAASSRVLRFGQFVSIMLLAIWTASGMAFPIAIGWDASSGHGFGFYAHFFLSLALCGVAVTSYPYLLITALAVDDFIPALVRRGLIPGPKRQDLQFVAKLNLYYLGQATLVPLLGVLMLVVFGSQDAWARWPLVAVSGGGLVGCAAMWALERKLRLDIDALTHIAFDERRSIGQRSSRGSARGSKLSTPSPPTNISG